MTQVKALAAWAQPRPSPHAPVDIASRLLRRDTAIAGGILGGGMAYRLFFWTLALAVLVCGGLGFIPGSRIDTAAGEAGLTSSVATTVAEAASQAHSSRWLLVGIGLVSVAVTSWAVLRTIRLIHAAAWQTSVTPLRHPPAAVAAVAAGPFLLAVLSGLAGWARTHTALLGGILAMALWGLAVGLLWLLVSLRLPRRDAPWTALIPGAVVVGLGAEVIHIVTVSYLSTKLATASALYGTLGLTATLLVYLYMFGRMIVLAAELSAVVWERSSSPQPAAS